MAVGDSADILWRLKSLIPGGWFLKLAPVRDAVLGGIADSMAASYALLTAVRASTRIATSSGWFLDLIAFDFLGPYFLRRAGEADASWRTRFINEIFRERVTRAGVIDIAEQVTGLAPKLIEPFNPGDCGGYNTGALAWAGMATPAPALSGWNDGPGGWSVAGDFALVTPAAAVVASPGAGCWGSLNYPLQIFLTVYRQPGQGTPIVAGYDTSAGGFDVGAIEWTSTQQTGVLTDDEIYAAIARTVAAGVTAWVAIINATDGSVSSPTGAQQSALDFSVANNSDLLLML